MDYDKWISAGERLGLTGQDLRDYVDKREREFDEREEGAARREIDAYRRDEEKLRLENEMLEREAMIKREEAACKRAEQEREIEILKLRAATGIVKSGSDSSNKLRPKLPKFEETKDDMDSYIERFERFAKAQGWSVDTWAVSLSSLLTGKGLAVYTSMPADQANDYPALKKAMLKRYQLTEEGFRLKFRESKPAHEETVLQFMARLERYFTRWVEMSQSEESFESLMDLIVREQFIGVCSTDLALF